VFYSNVSSTFHHGTVCLREKVLFCGIAKWADCISVFLICAASLLTLLFQGCVEELSCVMMLENNVKSALFRLKDALWEIRPLFLAKINNSRIWILFLASC